MAEGSQSLALFSSYAPSRVDRRTFSAISAAAAIGLAASCGSFSEAPEADGGGPDAGQSDATPDGRAEADASPEAVPRCTGQALVDETFDQPSDVAGWTVTPGAEVSAVDAGLPPPALFARSLSDEKVDHTLKRTLDLEGRGIVCIELDVRLESTGAFTADAYSEILGLNSASGSIYLEMRAQGFSLA